MNEFEYRCSLNKKQYELVHEIINKDFVEKLQINYYYDTPDLFFDQQNTTVRIRQIEGLLKGTIKVHATDNASRSIEESFGVETLPNVIRCGSKKLVCYGQMITERKTWNMHKGITLMLDKNYYLGTVDYILELEYPQIFQEDADKIIKKLTKELGICFTKDNKSKRFFHLLKHIQEGSRNGIDIKYIEKH